MTSKQVTVSGEGLSLDDIVAVSRRHADAKISESLDVGARVLASEDFVRRAVASGVAIYGVTTGVGANATQAIPREEVEAMQENLLWLLKAGSGERIGSDAVRAGMLLRLNSLLRGVSGIRMDLLRRLETFLNEDVVPHVLEHGSIGASGDLVPLAYVTGALIGLDNDFRVDLRGEEMGAVEALAQLGLDRERLRAKEGLALINGNSMMTGLAALCVADTKDLLLLAHGVHALAVQALCGSEASFAPFIHEHKPHPGQLRSAAWMRALLAASRMTTEGVKGHYAQPDNALIQDRYSLRCLPQFMAPLLEGIAHIEGQIEIEANCANDNPLFDVETGTTYNGGNFLGQVVGVGMDQLRFYIGLMAKHLDTQLSLLMSPEFSNGLPMSLSGDPNRTWNMGLKGLQVLGNSMMPILTFMGNTMTDRFPTHAEQFNQNVNSQGYGAANLGRRSVETAQQYMAVALLVSTQAVDLRTRVLTGQCDARVCLSPGCTPLYEVTKEILSCPTNKETPLLPTDDAQHVDAYVKALVQDIKEDGRLVATLTSLQDVR